jgi:hypothetical protein
VWESFNDVAEGFGLSIEEFLEINRTALKVVTCVLSAAAVAHPPL